MCWMLLGHMTLSDSMNYSLPSLCPWDFPGKNTIVSCYFLLQIFPTQGSNPSFSVFCIARWILYHCATWLGIKKWPFDNIWWKLRFSYSIKHCRLTCLRYTKDDSENKLFTSFYLEHASLLAQLVKKPPAMQSPRFNPWMGKIPWRRKWQHSSILAWNIPWTEEPDALQSLWGCKQLGTTEQPPSRICTRTGFQVYYSSKSEIKSLPLKNMPSNFSTPFPSQVPHAEDPCQLAGKPQTDLLTSSLHHSRH